MTTSTNSDNFDWLGSSIDIAMLEVEFRKDKAKAKSNFTRAQTNLLLMVKYQNLPSRSGVWDACHNIDMCMEIVMELLSNFTTIYIKGKEIQKANVVVSEMEKIERDFTSTYEPRSAKTGLRGFRPGLTQTTLCSYRRWLEA